MLLTGTGGLTGRSFKPTGLAPQKVAEVDNSNPTRDTYQRKVFYDGVNFFIVYSSEPTDVTKSLVNYTASSDAITWATPVTLWTYSIIPPYYGGNIDIQYPNRGAKDAAGKSYHLSIVFSGYNGTLWRWYAVTISGQTLTKLSGSALGLGVGGIAWQGGSIVANLLGTYDIWVAHRGDRLEFGYRSTEGATSTDIPYGGTTTGGAQILSYETSSPFNLFVLAKGSDDKLYYNLVDPSGTPSGNSFVEIATLGTGFSDFCGCSEAQNVGDPERVHLVYIKSTGELCYRKFENDAFGSERVLVTSGASYPVIAAGTAHRLYVFYVKDGKIYVIHYMGAWLNPVELFTADHTYNAPAYLSTNQYVQNGKICLVWTEGTASPYEVWFCYLED